MKKTKRATLPEKHDALRELCQGKLSLRRLYRLDRQIIESPHAPRIAELLGLSKVESTATLHGVPHDVLAKWRYEGWPGVCAKCGKKINVRRFGWWAGKKKRGQFVLHHISCL